MIPISWSPVSPGQMADLVSHLLDGDISGHQGKIIFDEMWNDGMIRLKKIVKDKSGR